MKSSYSRSFSRSQLDLNQPYHKMNKREKRLYKRWLAKNNQWDGEVVIENMKRNGTLTIEPPI